MRKAFFRIKQFVALIIGIFVVLFINGCAETTQFDDVWESRLKGCSLNCHSPGGVASDGPDMSTQDKFFSNVVDKTVNIDYPNWTLADRNSTCGDLKLINPGNASSSALVAGLVSSVSSAQNCGTSFNYHLVNNETTETDDYADLVKWINDGATKE